MQFEERQSPQGMKSQWLRDGERSYHDSTLVKCLRDRQKIIIKKQKLRCDDIYLSDSTMDISHSYTDILQLSLMMNITHGLLTTNVDTQKTHSETLTVTHIFINNPYPPMELDISELSKWNCIIEPKTIGTKSSGGLYLGDIDCAQDQYLLTKLHIGAVLSVIDQNDFKVPSQITQLHIPIPDSQAESLIAHFQKCQQFIDDQRRGTNVMVHCFAGISRSATIVIAYLMHHFDWKLERAFSIVKALRKQVKPNEGFLRQLKEFESMQRLSLTEEQEKKRDASCARLKSLEINKKVHRATSAHNQSIKIL